jgi:hypothetical protein
VVAQQQDLKKHQVELQDTVASIQQKLDQLLARLPG